VDTTYSWTNNWINLQTVTGITALDALLAKYGFTVTGFYHPHYGNNHDHAATLSTSQSLNEYILCDSLESFPGIFYAYQNSLGGQGSYPSIEFSDTNDVKYYSFKFGWGMAGSHYWKYKVYPDCSIEFLGNGPNWWNDSLPEPVNCNILDVPHSSVSIKEFTVYPNPSTGPFIILQQETNSHNTLTILNLKGQEILQLTIKQPSTQIDVSTLPRGVYFIKIHGDQTIQVIKLLKQ